jgi:hypothetical protein
MSKRALTKSASEIAIPEIHRNLGRPSEMISRHKPSFPCTSSSTVDGSRRGSQRYPRAAQEYDRGPRWILELRPTGTEASDSGDRDIRSREQQVAGGIKMALMINQFHRDLTPRMNGQGERCWFASNVR